MKSARLIIEERNEAWTLVIEPWALALDIAAGARVHVEIFDNDDVFYLEISEEGTFLAFESPKFQVTVGGVEHDYDFGAARPLMFDDDSWKSSPR